MDGRRRGQEDQEEERIKSLSTQESNLILSELN